MWFVDALGLCACACVRCVCVLVRVSVFVLRPQVWNAVNNLLDDYSHGVVHVLPPDSLMTVGM